MAVIHHTTLSPTKLELLAAWLPGQDWYTDRGRAPELAKAGGFRLDDPPGEGGIEVMGGTGGIGDPVLVGQLVALIQGQAQPQMQSVSDAPDPTVTWVPVAVGTPMAV